MGTLRLGKRTDKKSPLIKDVLSLADINDIEFLAGMFTEIIAISHVKNQAF